MKVVLLGEQETGKSSLLVGLYGALLNRRVDGLRLVRTNDDVEFLSRGLEAFSARQSLRRTEVRSRARLLVDVVHGERSAALDISDRSGELLGQMLNTRSWDPELHEDIRDAGAAMLFIRADRSAAASDVRERAATLPPAAPAPDPRPLVAVGGGSPEQQTDGSSALLAAATSPMTLCWSDLMSHGWSEIAAERMPRTRQLVESTPRRMPFDVRTVDVLQALMEERARPLPLAVVLSAWDRVPGLRAATPCRWLADNVPLLNQFLRSHDGQLPHAIFGVSAQGEDFAEQDQAHREDPWDRAFAISPDGNRGTLADPLLWLLGQTA